MDWVALLEAEMIPYVTRGPNTKRGEVSVKCPWCAEEDPSEHMGISLTSENWGCYRNAAHRGHVPHRLVAALLGCHLSQARLIVSQYSAPDPDGLDEALAGLLATSDGPKAEKPPPKLYLPDDFKLIANEGTRVKYWNYLKRRGFDPVGTLTFRYRLLCCSTGLWKDRIIFPFYQEGELVGWTGRALAANPIGPRYLSSSEAVKNTVLFEDELQQGGKGLVIVEGPFDALKLDYYGQGILRSTCVFGTSFSNEQAWVLRQLAKRYSKTIVLFDRGAMESALNLVNCIPDSTIGLLDKRFKDPGEMAQKDVEELVASLVKL